MMVRRIAGWALVGVILAACGTVAAPVRTFVKGDEVAYYDFSEPNTFEEGTYGEGAARLQIRDGVYHIVVTEGDSEIWYGQWGDTYQNVVIDVEARQISEGENTVYGVMCRMRGRVGQPVEVETTPEATAEATLAATGEATPEAAEVTPEATVAATGEATPESTTIGAQGLASEATAEATAPLRRAGDPTPVTVTDVPRTSELNINNGDGYLFLVEGTGRFAIMRARGRNVVPLVDWTSSDKIRKGPAQNTIRAVCLNDYLALYVNGAFMADAIDDTYTSGQVGLVAAAASRLGVTVDFDNLTVSEARTS
ncbi:MAG: hypothetical protein HZC41_23595 [Chloroflexi bacterium]|nr:hypothetical protein [Chloroflexota bacterium]